MITYLRITTTAPIWVGGVPVAAGETRVILDKRKG